MPGVIGVVESIPASRWWRRSTGRRSRRSPRFRSSGTCRPWPASTRRRSRPTTGPHSRTKRASRRNSRADPETALAASLTVAADYWAPYLAHAPMEPMNAVVRIEHGEADVWSGTQAIGAAQGLVARVAGLDKDRVRAHSTYLGGAFGRRMTLTHVVEAARPRSPRANRCRCSGPGRTTSARACSGPRR